MTHVTPLRLIVVALFLGIVGGSLDLYWWTSWSGVFVFFLAGNSVLALAGLAGFLGVMSLAVEVGVRAALRVREPRPERAPASLELRKVGT